MSQRPMPPESSRPSEGTAADNRHPAGSLSQPSTGSFASAPTGAPSPHSTPAGAESRIASGAGGVVGDYQLLEELAHGGMGVVYKARHRTLGRLVALKTMRADALSHPHHGQRFEREMRAAARLRHPHIVPIYEVGRHEGQPFYTMPFLAGGSLLGQRQRYTDDPAAAVALVAKVARAVQHAHEQGVLHRDLKPSNVLLDDQGEPAVSDFGLARLSDADTELTQAGAVLGTPSYMAPEQAAGRTRDVGPAADIWALGVLLYELLAGRRPFLGESGDEVKMKILLERPPAPRKLRPDIPRALEAVVLKCLEKEPGRRYLSAGALADDLERCLRREAPRGTPSPWARLLPTGLRRRPLRAALLAVVALVAVVLALQSWDKEPPEQAGTAQVLLGDSGPPARVRWVLGENSAAVLPAGANEPFTVRAERLALMELAEPPWPAYRLRADVRQEAGEGVDAGIYVAYEKYVNAQGGHHVYLHLGFGDRGDLSGSRGLSLSRFEDFLRGISDDIPYRGRRDFQAAAWQGQEMPWRPLALEWTAEGVKAFWGDECIADIPRQELQSDRERLLARAPGLQRESSHPAVGLFVARGQASFRRVVLSPP